ncbi:MAG TPA: cytochrome C oxidase subunit IV family protein [Verrucomicrobiae bacterium]|nr:cytochrome C oxidase subunit IV family protein [Verrucomicrobiae bacterium]
MTSSTIVPVRVYAAVYGALMVLLLATCAADFLSLGVFNVVISLTIAVAKALLVILFFMHVRYKEHLLWVYVVAGFFWLAILIGLSLGDVLTRVH